MTELASRLASMASTRLLPACWVLLDKYNLDLTQTAFLLNSGVPAHLRSINDSQPIGEDLTVLSGRRETLCISKRSVGYNTEHNDREKGQC